MKILNLRVQPMNSFQRKPGPYICGLRTGIECEHGSEHSTHSDRVTNIGFWLSLEASLPHKLRFISTLH